jgi:beta-glucoside kinase
MNVMNIAAFDIGGTALKMGIVTTQGELLHRDKAAIKNSDGDAILSEMLQWVALHPDLEGIAISAPGYVNPHTGYIEMGGAIRRFDNFAMQEWLSAQTGLPVTVENDANCVLLAERWQGKAAGTDNFLVLTIGTGIGGAIFCNGKLVHGARFRAGEFGYMLTERADSRKVARHSMNENCTLRTLRKRYADYHGQGLDDVTGRPFLMVTMRAMWFAVVWSMTFLTALRQGFTTWQMSSIHKPFLSAAVSQNAQGSWIYFARILRGLASQILPMS